MQKLFAQAKKDGERLKMVGIDLYPSMIAAIKEATENSQMTFAGFVRDAIQKELDRKEKLVQRRRNVA